MPLGTLQHITIEPSDRERTKAFYCDALGLQVGDRPPLDFPGYWLYSAGVATVQLEQIVPRTGDTQFFLYDPDGVGLALNFPNP
jgi:catechol 2,3-dioxygenase-like lactoylglutathione lyase family enzyme